MQWSQPGALMKTKIGCFPVDKLRATFACRLPQLVCQMFLSHR